MTVEPLVPAAPLAPAPEPDAPLAPVPDAPLAPGGDASSFAGALERALDDAGGALERAERAERSFTQGRGGLQEMVLERAQADVALSLATAAASRGVQALTAIMSMQV
jgi:flagellar hook-basal body complex protein FliE